MGAGDPPEASSRKDRNATSKSRAKVKDVTKKKKNKGKSKSSMRPKKRRRHDSDSCESSSDSGYGESREKRKKGEELKKKRKKTRRSASIVSPSPPQKRSGKTKKKSVDNDRGRTKKRKSERGRDRNVSSSSCSDYSKRKRSPSCSTCRSENISSEDSAPQRFNKHEQKDISLKKSIKKKNKRGRSRRRRSRSCSTCSPYISSGRSSRSPSKQRLSANKDDGRVEIIQDYADFLPSKSNDSLDGLRKRERRFVDAGGVMRMDGSYVDLEEDDTRNDQKEFSSATGPQLDKGVDEICDRYNFGNDVSPYESVMVKSLVVVPIDNSDTADNSRVDDLELLLRQKALENLKKFRSGNSASATSFNDHKADFLKIETSKKDVKVEVKQTDQSTTVIDIVEEKKPIASVEESGGIQCASNLPECKGKIIANSPSMTSIAQICQMEKNGDLMESRSNFGNNLKQITTTSKMASISKHKESSNSSSHLQSNQGCFNTSLKQSVIENNTPIRTAKEIIANNKETKNVAYGLGSGMSSVTVQKAGYSNTNEQKGAADSELEKKTMTVMRGGEMVQVSYKVYIPKKTPALARRQINR